MSEYDKQIFADNLNKYIRLKKLTQSDIAGIASVSKSTVSSWCNAQKIPRMGKVQLLADYFGILKSDLIEDKSQLVGFDLFSIPGIMPIKTKKFPLLGEISCGELKYVDEDFQGYVEAGSDIHADFVMRAKGDSMIGAFIRDGDLVFVRQQPTVEHGEIAVVIVEDEATLKRFYQYGDTMVLKAENPSYKDIEVKIDEEHNIRILGKAIAFQSDAR